MCGFNVAVIPRWHEGIDYIRSNQLHYTLMNLPL